MSLLDSLNKLFKQEDKSYLNDITPDVYEKLGEKGKQVYQEQAKKQNITPVVQPKPVEVVKSTPKTDWSVGTGTTSSNNVNQVRENINTPYTPSVEMGKIFNTMQEIAEPLSDVVHKALTKSKYFESDSDIVNFINDMPRTSFARFGLILDTGTKYIKNLKENTPLEIVQSAMRGIDYAMPFSSASKIGEYGIEKLKDLNIGVLNDPIAISLGENINKKVDNALNAISDRSNEFYNYYAEEKNFASFVGDVVGSLAQYAIIGTLTRSPSVLFGFTALKTADETLDILKDENYSAQKKNEIATIAGIGGAMIENISGIKFEDFNLMKKATQTVGDVAGSFNKFKGMIFGDKIKTIFTRGVKPILQKAMPEGMEEIYQSLELDLIKGVFTSKDIGMNTREFYEDKALAFLGGALGGGIFGGVKIISDHKTRNRIKENLVNNLKKYQIPNPEKVAKELVETFAKNEEQVNKDSEILNIAIKEKIDSVIKSEIEQNTDLAMTRYKEWFGDELIELHKNIENNPKAVGAYSEGITKLLSGRVDIADTMAHESVHKYIGEFMTEKDKNDLFEVAKEQYKIEDLNALEEKIAEDFIAYTKSREGVTGKIRIFFDKLIARLKSFLTNKADIEGFYANIISGKAKSMIGTKGSQTTKFRETTEQTAKRMKAEGKSFDEFLKAQPTGYHFTSPETNITKWSTKKSQGRIWFTDNPNVGENVGASGKGKMYTVQFDKNAKWATREQADKSFTDQLIAEGYDGVYHPDSTGEYGNYYEVFNPKVIKTKSELEKIWKEANKTKYREIDDINDDDIKKYATPLKNKALVINADEYQKNLAGYDPKNPELVHRAGSDIAQRVFEEAVKNPKFTSVEFIAGGAGSGKSESYVDENVEGRENVIIFDGTLQNKLKAERNMLMAKLNKKDVKIIFILTDILDAWNFNTGRERTVGKEAFVKTHVNARNNVYEFSKEGVKIKIIKNVKEEEAEILEFNNKKDEIAFLENVLYNASAINNLINGSSKRENIQGDKVRDNLYGEEITNDERAKGLLGDREKTGRKKSPKFREDLTNTDNFKRWFGDSKVVDENGKPLVVYHGSPAIFDTFDASKTGGGHDAQGAGFYFTDSEAEANRYTDGTQRRTSNIKEVGKIYPVYLKIENPVSLTKKASRSTIVKLVLKSLGFKSEEEMFEAFDNDIDLYYNSNLSNWSEYPEDGYRQFISSVMQGKSAHDMFQTVWNEAFNADNKAYLDAVSSLGYDGVIIPNKELHGGNTTHYIVFKPNNIKSVDNNGDFSLYNDNIKYREIENIGEGSEVWEELEREWQEDMEKKVKEEIELTENPEKEMLKNKFAQYLNKLLKYFPPKKREDIFESSDYKSVIDKLKEIKEKNEFFGNTDSVEAFDYLRKLDEFMPDAGIDTGDLENFFLEITERAREIKTNTYRGAFDLDKPINTKGGYIVKNKPRNVGQKIKELQSKPKKISKSKINKTVGIKKPSITEIVDDEVVTFNTRDLSKFYKDLEQGRTKKVQSAIREMMTKAKEEKLLTNARKIVKDTIGEKRKSEISDEQIKKMELEVMAKIEEKREFLERRVNAESNKGLLSRAKEFTRNSFKSPRSILKGLGEKGAEIAKMIDDSDIETRVQNALDLRAIQTVNKLDDKEKKRFADIVEKKEPPNKVSDNMKEAVQSWSILSEIIYDRAKEVGLDIGYIQNYFPRYLKEVFLSDINSYNANKFAVDLLMKEGMSESRAKQIWSDFKIDRVRDRKSGHLEISRKSKLPDSFFERDPSVVLKKYIREVNKRIADIKFLGKGYENILNILKEMDLEGNTEKAIIAFNQYEYIFKDHKMGSIGRALSFWNSLKLSLSAIMNLTEPVFVMTRAGIFPTIKNMLEATTKKGMERASTYVDLEQTVSKIAEHGGLDRNFFLDLVQFTRTQNWADRVKVLSGIDYAQRNANLLIKNPKNLVARTNLERMAINPDNVLKNGGLTEEDKSFAGNKMLGDLMPINRLDLPVYWKTPIGREVFKFKSFAYKTGGFLWDNVIGELHKGNIKPLLILIIIGALLGEASKDLRDWIRTGEVRKMPESFRDWTYRIIENVSELGGFGMISDVAKSVEYSRWNGALATYLGATAGDIERVLMLGGDFYDIGNAVVSGGDIRKETIQFTEKFLKFITKRLVPFVGSRVAKKIDFEEEKKSSGSKIKFSGNGSGSKIKF